MKMSKKSIVIIFLLIIIISFSLMIGLRVKVYSDYLNSLEKLEDFSYDTLRYEGELLKSSVVFDNHLYFLLDNPYHLWKQNKTGVDYQYKDENKYISIMTSEESMNDLVENYYRDTGLSKEKAKSIIEKHDFSNVLEVSLYAFNNFNRKKISIFSTKEEIEEEILFNSLIFQQFIQARFVVDENERVKVINGNVNGIEILDGIFQITNGQESYIIAFVGQHERKEIDRFMKSVHIK